MNIPVTIITVGVVAFSASGFFTQSGQELRSKIYLTACDLFHYSTNYKSIPLAMKRIVDLRSKIDLACLEIAVMRDPSERFEGRVNQWWQQKEKEEFENEFRLKAVPIVELFDYIQSDQMASLLSQVFILKQKNLYAHEVASFESELNQMKSRLLYHISKLGLSRKTSMSYSPRIGTQFLCSNIKACLCKLVQKDRRVRFNESLCQQLSQIAQKINRSITIRSIGSGQCFQELSLHARLTLEGHKVNWILQDPKFKWSWTEESSAAIEFSKLVKFFSPDTTVKIEADELRGYGEKLKNGMEALSDVMMMVDAGVTHDAFCEIMTKAKTPSHSNILLATMDGQEVEKFTLLSAAIS